MEADFKGYATKAGLKCSDGRTILPDAFAHQDKMQVPLVWQHGHTNPENVLGHVILENRQDGVYAYGFFNGTPKAKHAKEAVAHKDINAMSIWANQLAEKGKLVMHGVIREVSLVLSGANPGALIDHVTIRHGEGEDMYEETLDDEAIIYSGETIVHDDSDTETVTHADGGEETVEDVYNTFSEKQKQVVHYLIGQAVSDAGGSVKQSDLDLGEGEAQEIYDSLDDNQKQLFHDMIGEALGSSESNENDENNENNNDSKGTEMKHNVFEDGADGSTISGAPVLSHSDQEELIKNASRPGATLKTAIEDYALAHGIQDIDVLFPDAKTITDAPELFSRRTEWVAKLLAGVRKSPFARIKTMSADITVQEARAKGYIKGDLKKEEFFRVAKRTTTPQTVYKKQKLDRDDMVDITDFDVVTWLKGEMRLMLDEEVARAILVGDGRPVDSEDKIQEDHIRPVANDHELYTTTVNVNIDDASSSIQEVLDAIVMNRQYLRPSGQPILFTTESYISRFLLLRDGVNRKVYKSLDEVASDLRVSEIVPVEILEEYSDVVAIIFNPTDYVVGADKGGNVAMFDDFDIDYNQYKYLIETRASGALVKLKAAMVIRKTDAASVVVIPAAPTFDPETGEITITDQTGVVYRNADTDAVMNTAGSPYEVPEGDTVMVVATPAAGRHFPSSEDDSWTFTNEA